jgi:hypothetical protein
LIGTTNSAPDVYEATDTPSTRTFISLSVVEKSTVKRRLKKSVGLMLILVSPSTGLVVDIFGADALATTDILVYAS